MRTTTDRERLIDRIINTPKKEYPVVGGRLQGKTYRTAEMIADHILSDGWIRPPCKPGDTVYFDNTGYHDSAEIDGIHIDENGIAFSWVQYDVGVDITELWDEGEFDIEEIGKTVFLTREEAEKALAEREGAPNAGNS